MLAASALNQAMTQAGARHLQCRSALVGAVAAAATTHWPEKKRCYLRRIEACSLRAELAKEPQTQVLLSTSCPSALGKRQGLAHLHRLHDSATMTTSGAEPQVMLQLDNAEMAAEAE